MASLICGSIAYDTIMNFEGKFADQILPEQIHILNVAFLVPTMRREFGGHCHALLMTIPTTLTALEKSGENIQEELPTLAVRTFLPWQKRMPTLILEGTGDAEDFVLPAGEEVLQIPFALSVADEHQQPFHRHVIPSTSAMV